MDAIKTVIAEVLRVLIRVLSLGRFHRDRVVFFSYFGKQYSCNPYYISELLRKKAPECRIVWAFCDPDKYRYLEQEGIRVVKYNSLPFLRILMTSGVIVTNSEIPSWWAFGRKQTLINTWHGGGAYKKVGAAYQKETEGKQKRGAIARRTPCIYLSSSRAFTEQTLRDSFGHTGEVLAYGMPRNDILINGGEESIIRHVRDVLHIEEGQKIALYAPTYRESKDASEYALDLVSLKTALADRFGGEWVVLYRMHYLVMNALEGSGEYLDASGYPNMQELLYASDVLLTDFSSSIWDYSFTGKPCFLYAPDLDQYDLLRGFYSDIHSWPFPLAESPEELAAVIRSFDETAYHQAVRAHQEELGSCETGKASQHAVQFILKKMYGKKWKEKCCTGFVSAEK